MGEIKKNLLANNFFTKKRILLFTILTIIIIVFISLTSVFLFQINFNDIFSLISNSYKTNDLFWLWLFLLLLQPTYSIIWRIYMFKIKLTRFKITIRWYEWIIFSFIGSFINSITPFAIGNEPYTIFWLRTKGVSLKDASIIVASTGIFSVLSQILITWPSFFYISSLYETKINNSSWISCYWLTFTGLICDLLAFSFYWFITCSKNFHYYFNLVLHFFRKKIGMTYKEKSEINIEFRENQVFKKQFLEELKIYKHSIVLIIGGFLWNVIYYLSLVFAYKFLYPDLQFSWMDIFNYVNVATTANNFIPIPGAEGTLQYLLSMFIINGSSFLDVSDSDVIKQICNNSIFIWRFMTFYLPSFAGMVAFPFAVWISTKDINKFINVKRKKQEKMQIDSKDIVISDSI